MSLGDAISAFVQDGDLVGLMTLAKTSLLYPKKEES